MDRTYRKNGRMLNTFNILTRKPTGKRPLGTARREENIINYLKETGVDIKKWIDSVQFISIS